MLQYPLTQQKSKIIKPGFINDVSIDAVKVISKNEIKAAATSELRGCLFEDELSSTDYKLGIFSNIWRAQNLNSEV